tara:strand:+ start:114 stop:827 length:714 start_codon:yes stop_codon:yes gene_type:complete
MEVTGFPNYTIYPDGTLLNHETFRIMGVTDTRKKFVVSLTYGTKKKVCDYARLVAEHYLADERLALSATSPFPIVVHKDQDHTNYHVDNLMWTRKGEDVRKYTPKEAYESRKATCRKSRNKRDAAGLVKPEQRKWRQSDYGHFTRNRNHWQDAKVREPSEGWEDYYFNTFIPSTHCELCHVELNQDGIEKTKKCLEHDHMSGYIRSICCRTCNQGQVRIFDQKRMILMVEIHRYHLR